MGKTPTFFVEGHTMNNSQLLDELRNALMPMLDAQGIEIIEIGYKGHPSRMVLSFIVDKVGGITLNECAKLNQDIGRILDEQDIVKAHYVLEVSSPGLDRPCRAKRDFERAMYSILEIDLKDAVSDKKFYRGTLIGVNDNLITLEIDDGVNVKIPLEKIQLARRQITF